VIAQSATTRPFSIADTADIRTVPVFSSTGNSVYGSAKVPKQSNRFAFVGRNLNEPSFRKALAPFGCAYIFVYRFRPIISVKQAGCVENWDQLPSAKTARTDPSSTRTV